MDNNTKGMFAWEPGFLPTGDPARVMMTFAESRTAVITRTWVGGDFTTIPANTPWPSCNLQFVTQPGGELIATLELVPRNV